MVNEVRCYVDEWGGTDIGGVAFSIHVGTSSSFAFSIPAQEAKEFGQSILAAVKKLEEKVNAAKS